MPVTNTNSFADFSKKLLSRVKEIQKKVESLDGQKIVVGIPPSAKYPDGKSVAEVAECISYGYTEKGRPMRAGPRRFLTVAKEENGGKWSRLLQRGVREAFRKEKDPDIRPILMKLGERMKNDIKRTMMSFPDPVYDTGRMHDSISILQVNNEVLQS